MGKWCPHSPLSIWLYNTFLRQNRVSPEVITELSQVAEKVRNALVQQKIELNFRYIPDMDIERINAVFWDFISRVLEDSEISKKLSSYISKSWKFFLEKNHNESLQQLLTIALTDIFSLVAMQINYDIDKNKLKGLLYLNMNFWDNNLTTNISRIIQLWVLWKKRPEEILTQLKSINGPRDIKKYGEPACPFYLDENTTRWINAVWDFLENVTFPQLQEQYKTRTHYWEKFYTGNI